MVEDQEHIRRSHLEYLKRCSRPGSSCSHVQDLGIIRDIHLRDEEVEVVITPTYSGCPAMDMIATNIRLVLLEKWF
jgi:ring-1,2-phenylacetyl-CoA epoxidase subunit PaaD